MDDISPQLGAALNGEDLDVRCRNKGVDDWCDGDALVEGKVFQASAVATACGCRAIETIEDMECVARSRHSHCTRATYREVIGREVLALGVFVPPCPGAESRRREQPNKEDIFCIVLPVGGDEGKERGESNRTQKNTEQYSNMEQRHERGRDEGRGARDYYDGEYNSPLV